jgi:hypothetical protein
MCLLSSATQECCERRERHVPSDGRHLQRENLVTLAYGQRYICGVDGLPQVSPIKHGSAKPFFHIN